MHEVAEAGLGRSPLPRTRLRSLLARGLAANPPLLPRIVLTSALLAALVAALFAVLVLAVSSLRDTSRGVTASKDMTAATLVLQRDLNDLETSLRGFVISGDARFLRRFRTALRSLPASVAEVRRLAAASPGQATRVARLVGAVNAYVDDYAIPLATIARISPTAARAAVATAEGRRRFETIRRQFDGVLRVENELAGTRVASASRQADRAVNIALAALGGCVLIVLLYGLQLVFGIARPVRRTADAATRMAEGDLSVRLPARGPGEVHDLAVAFNRMAVSLDHTQRDLQAQNEELREAQRQRSELISAVAHEVRTPLACVLGYTSLLLTREVDPAERRRYLQIVEQEARRLGSLIDDFLVVKRIEEGRLELRDEEVELAEVVREQVASFSGRTEHDFRVEVDESALVRGDRARLAQVVANLLANAVKYSPEGTAIDVALQRRGRVVRATVRDQGIGIPEQHRGRVFTKFFRGEAPRRGIAGVGLGLAISRDIVEAHGGKMGFESAVGAGSLFWFEVPLHRGAAPSPVGPRARVRTGA